MTPHCKPGDTITDIAGGNSDHLVSTHSPPRPSFAQCFMENSIIASCFSLGTISHFVLRFWFDQTSAETKRHRDASQCSQRFQRKLRKAAAFLCKGSTGKAWDI